MSEIRATTISDETGNGPIALTKQHAAKVWVNFTSITTTALRDSINVSSLTDNGTGQTTINITSAMSNTNYTGSWFTNANSGSAIGSFSNQFTGNFILRTTTNYQVASYGTSAYADALHNDSTIFGDLA
mgnify:CR=1 FL=1